MSLSPRLILVALVLLVLPAAVTALFLARQARWAVAPGAQPGGRITGRLAPIGGVAGDASLENLAVEIVGVARDGSTHTESSGLTNASGRFELEVQPLDGHYEARIEGGGWQTINVPISLVDGLGKELLIPVRPAARIELTFVRRSGVPVRGGEWSLDGEVGRSWFSAWSGRLFERRGTFTGPDLVVDGLSPMRAHVVIRLDGGDRTELVMDLVVGPNRHTVDL